MGDTARRQLIEALQRENKALKDELAMLRLIVTEKFAEADFHVKAEDAADLLKWAAHPEAVRELMKHTPAYQDEDLVCPASECVTEHGRWPHTRACAIAAAWRALEDPRAAADHELAYEQAIAEDYQRAVNAQQRGRALEGRLGSRMTATERLGSRMTATEISARREELMLDGLYPGGRQRVRSALEQQFTYRSALPPIEWRAINFDTPQGLLSVSRAQSDVRGLETVEQEARDDA